MTDLPANSTNVIHGTKNLYGFAVGILMIEGYFPRPPGAIGNAMTFPYPVLHQVVKGASGAATVRSLPTLQEDSVVFQEAVAPWLEGARDLERQGVRAISTSCGFAALFQRQLTEAVDVPVFATSLLLAPIIARALKPGAKVGVVTADARMLNKRHLLGSGIDPETVAVVGLEGCSHFEEMTFGGRHDINLSLIESEVLQVTQELLQREPAVRAILLECSLLPPYAAAVQKKTGLPVFDFTHLINFMHTAMVREPYSGFL